MIHEAPNRPEIWICPLCGIRKLLPIVHLASSHARIVPALDLPPTCMGCGLTFPHYVSGTKDIHSQNQHVKSCEKLQIWLAQQMILEVTQ